MLRSPERPLLTVVIPCFNEATTILGLIERVRSSPIDSKQIIVVDDGSSDGTRELLQQLQADDLTVLLHDRNRGKGAALATGFTAARGEICIVQDADLEYDPMEYPLVIGPIVKGKAEDARVSVRNIRRKAKDDIDALKGEVGDDDISRGEKELEAATKAHIDQIDEALKRKEAELLEV